MKFILLTTIVVLSLSVNAQLKKDDIFVQVGSGWSTGSRTLKYGDTEEKIKKSDISFLSGYMLRNDLAIGLNAGFLSENCEAYKLDLMSFIPFGRYYVVRDELISLYASVGAGYAIMTRNDKYDSMKGIPIYWGAGVNISVARNIYLATEFKSISGKFKQKTGDLSLNYKDSGIYTGFTFLF